MSGESDYFPFEKYLAKETVPAIKLINQLPPIPLGVQAGKSFDNPGLWQKDKKSNSLVPGKIDYYWLGFGSRTDENRNYVMNWYAQKPVSIAPDASIMLYLFQSLHDPQLPKKDPRGHFFHNHLQGTEMLAVSSFDLSRINDNKITIDVVQFQGNQFGEHADISRQAYDEYNYYLGDFNWPKLFLHTIEQLGYFFNNNLGKIDLISVAIDDKREKKRTQSSLGKAQAAALEMKYSIGHVDFALPSVRLNQGDSRMVKKISSINPDNKLQQFFSQDVKR